VLAGLAEKDASKRIEAEKVYFKNNPKKHYISNPPDSFSELRLYFAQLIFLVIYTVKTYLQY